MLLAFLSLNSRTEHPPEFKGGTLSTFDLAEDAEDTPAKPAQKQAAAPKQPPHPVPPIPKPAIHLPDRPLPMLIVTKEVYAASDIAKLGKPAAGQGAEGASSGSSPGDSARVGTGPHGEPLYAAEWYREPTNQELQTYLPKTMPGGGGWGVIACKTIDRFHVDDCVELGQGPAGSHLASAARQAAWQFLVRPPRVGGKVLVGEWVRIRIDYHVGPPPGLGE